MNLSNCKTIEEYREAAHYWQKKWDETEKERLSYLKFINEFNESTKWMHEDKFLGLTVGDRFHIEGQQKLKIVLDILKNPLGIVEDILKIRQ